MSDSLLIVSQDILKKIERGTEHTNTLKDVLLEEMQALYGDAAMEKYEQIKLFLERTDDNHREIAEGKLEGRSSEAWLKGRLTTGEKSFPGLIEGLIDGLQAIPGGGAGREGLDVTNSFDLGIMSRRIKQDIELRMFSDVLSIDVVLDEADESGVASYEGYTRLKDAMKSDLNSEEDREMKELLTVSALKLIHDTDANSVLKKLNHVQTSFVVDAVYTSAKVAYKVAENSLTSEEAVDFLVDRGVARLESLVQVTCTNIGGKVGTQIGRVIGGVLGPAGSTLGGAVGGTIGKLVGKKVGHVIIEGTKKLIPAVKRGINRLVGATASTIKEGLKSMFSRIF